MLKPRLSLVRSTLIGISLCVGATATAQVGVGGTNWGTVASSFNLNCISADCGGGGVSGGASGPGTFENNIQGNPASTTISNSLGSSDATADFVELAPGLNGMLFTGDSTSGMLGTSDSNTGALAFYTYSGPNIALTITMTIAANASLVGPLSGEDSNIDGIRGTIYIFQDEFSIDEINFEANGAELFCLFECYIPDDEASVNIETGTMTSSITVNLVDGDEFFLYGQANIGAAGGGTADAGDGISVTFSTTSGLTSTPGGMAPVDSDGDGVADDADNCTMVANADQRDTNGDGYGNACDPDVNNDGTVNFIDIAAWSPFFNTVNNGDEDFNGDGIANFLDFALFPDYFLGPPGPSGVAP